jgi:hypothetical protein
MNKLDKRSPSYFVRMKTRHPKDQVIGELCDRMILIMATPKEKRTPEQQAEIKKISNSIWNRQRSLPNQYYTPRKRSVNT